MQENQISLSQFVKSKIEDLRKKLLDLTRRNPLISAKLSDKSNSIIRVVDELPDVLFSKISEGQMEIIPLPDLEEELADEKTPRFKKAFATARVTDEVYLKEIDEIDQVSEGSPGLFEAANRDLKDRLRDKLGLAPRQKKGSVSISEHARNHGISPSYDLPDTASVDRHTDNKVQTLMLPDALDARLRALLQKHKSWEQETGIHVLQAAFGFLEWESTADSKTSMAPLVLLPIDIERTSNNRSRYKIKGRGEYPELNVAIKVMLDEQYRIELPVYEDGIPIRDYLNELVELFSNKKGFKIRKQIAFGVFPSNRIAMYEDLDTSKWDFEHSEIVNRMIGGSDEGDAAAPFAGDYDVDDPLIEAKVPYLVSDADSSQFSVLADMAEGKNLAVEGPPGTGKSQTIVNTIAAAMADGKKVLFVAEKTAALEVVKSRLEACGLGQFLMPLQATRSSKTEVIASIKDRVEMDRVNLPENLPTKINQFRNERDRLQEYLDIISSDYGNSGFTVHKVLGLAMKYRIRYEQLPLDLKNRSSEKIVGIKKGQIEELLEICSDIQRSWEEAINSSTRWEGVRSTATSPLETDGILSLTIETRLRYEQLEESRNKIIPLGFSNETTIEALQNVVERLELAVSMSEEYDGKLLNKLIQSDHLSGLREFLDKASAIRDYGDWLQQYLCDLWDEELINRLIEAEETLDDCNMPTLCLDGFKRKLEELNTEISKLDSNSDLFTQIENILSDSRSISSAGLVAFCDIAKKYPREVFEMRHELMDDHSIRQIIRGGASRAEKLKAESDVLAQIFDMAILPSYEEIQDFTEVISEAGFFSFLSSDYRRAKKHFLLITKRSKFDKLEAAKDLKKLCSWMNHTVEYKEDPELNQLLSGFFKGIETDFTDYLGLVSFYEEVNGTFRRDNDPNGYLRDSLKNILADAIMGMPDISEDHPARIAEITPEQTTTLLKEKTLFRDKILKAIRDISGYREIFRETKLITKDLLNQFKEKIPEYKKEWHKLNGNKEISILLGEKFNGINTSGDELKQTLHLCSIILDLDESCRIPCSTILEANDASQILEDTSTIKDIFRLDELCKEYLTKLADSSGISESGIVTRAENDGIIQFLAEAGEDRQGLNAHASLAAAMDSLKEKGFGFVLDSLIDNSMNVSELDWALRAWIYQKMASDIYNSYPELGRFNGQRLDRIRHKIAKLDGEIIELSRESLACDLYQEAKPPTGNGRGNRGSWTEMSLIGHQINLKRPSTAPRALIRRASKALLELKPCWMMSPQAVAQYIPKGSLEFDLVVIDEASQMTPQSAIGALARAKQAMVVGDTNQLPPSSFFTRTFSDDEDSEDGILEESILELANASFRPKRRLRWHYRSRHSALIAFSNRYIYDDKLVVFPSPYEGGAEVVSLKEVKGLYSSGSNPTEAEAMVDAITSFMSSEMKKPESERKSLGVVLMNKKQTELLSELLEFTAQNKRSVNAYINFWKEYNDGLEEFIIKNLENIQGDERDVIFIGTVYGPEQEGRPVMQRFGPINGIAGKRRLNVLFTRAKHQIVTFSSMTSTDIIADETVNPGSNLLKKWLEYSKTGQLEMGGITNRDIDSEFEEFVIDQITAIGCEAVPQIGVKGYFIDIGVRHPEWPHGFLLGVECDGASYHSSRNARDRDRLRQLVLEGLGWKLHRIWSTDWFSDPRTEAEKLRKIIAETLEEKKSMVEAQKKQVVENEELDSALEPEPEGEGLELETN